MTTNVTTPPLENLTLLMGAVEDQRSRLLNVLGTVQCLKLAADRARHEEAPEFAGAVELLEEEVQRIVTALEEIELLKAAAAREARS